VERRKFLMRSAVVLSGATIVGGVAYGLSRGSGPMSRLQKSTARVLARRFDAGRAAWLANRIRDQYSDQARSAPFIGGPENLFTQWLHYGIYFLAVYRVVHPKYLLREQVGRVIFDIYLDMADHPAWLRYLVGALKYRSGYVDKMRRAAALSQQRRYPGDWVLEFVPGDGGEFDWGLDITECGILKYYRAQGVPELTPYICLGDYVISRAFDRGLVRHETLAEGGTRCDFRYQKDRPTYVEPLRNGWPPQFQGGA
jgi:hypothetical protein